LSQILYTFSDSSLINEQLKDMNIMLRISIVSSVNRISALYIFGKIVVRIFFKLIEIRKRGTSFHTNVSEYKTLFL